MTVLAYIIVAVAAYLIGSIPTGFLVARAKGIDIRAVGSGNIGATNAMRVLGKPAGIFVMLMDTAKGWIACWLGLFIYADFSSNSEIHSFHDFLVMLQQWESCAIVAGIFAVLGHNYTCWLKFKGGKGVATTAGVYLALAPEALGIALAVFVLAIFVTRYVSVGSIVAAIALPIAVYWTQNNDILNIVTLMLGVMAIYKHKSNIRRLLAGTENRLGEKTEAAK